MEHVPVYLSILFLLTVLATLVLFFRAMYKPLTALFVIGAWIILQSIINLRGFYLVTDSVPPRFMMVVLPPVLLAIGLVFTKWGSAFIAKLDLKKLTLLHSVRIPVELILFSLCFYKAIPAIMTFEGSNFDILAGLTAPIIYYLLLKNKINWKLLLAWNVISLLLLMNIVAIALLSAPFPFQKFAFDQPDIAILYFPYVLLPGCIVPLVLFSHLVVIKRLWKEKSIA